MKLITGEHIDFIKRKDITDPRSEFANKIADLMIENCGGNILTAAEGAEGIFEMFNENIRNAYEITWECPLFSLHEYNSLGRENYGLTTEEFGGAIKDIIKACNEYYTKK